MSACADRLLRPTVWTAANPVNVPNRSTLRSEPGCAWRHPGRRFVAPLGAPPKAPVAVITCVRVAQCSA
eukprot:4747318-Pyramimonas_sp.AAC.1